MFIILIVSTNDILVQQLDNKAFEHFHQQSLYSRRHLIILSYT